MCWLRDKHATCTDIALAALLRIVCPPTSSSSSSSSLCVGGAWCWWHSSGGQVWSEDEQGHCAVCTPQTVPDTHWSQLLTGKISTEWRWMPCDPSPLFSLSSQARETLAEIPDQFVSYMKAHSIHPNSPLRRNQMTTHNGKGVCRSVCTHTCMYM